MISATFLLCLAAGIQLIGFGNAVDLQDVLCSDNVKARSAVMGCLKQLPPKMKKLNLECRKETMMGNAANDEAFRMQICQEKALVLKMDTCLRQKKEKMQERKLSGADEKRRSRAVDCVMKVIKSA